MSLSAVRREFGSLSLAGRRAIVVGGTAGIGQGLAERLAKANVAVTVAGRSEQRGNAVVEALAGLSDDRAVAAQHRFVRLDASLMANCAAFAESELADAAPLHYLVMTQGIATTAGYNPTTEGLDLKLALHYFSRAELARRLAPKLAAVEDGRVLSVLSGGVHSLFASHEEDFTLEKGFTLANAANAAGTYNDAMAVQLHEQYPAVAVLHGAPGFVATNWGTELPTVMRWLTRAAQLFATSLHECGELLGAALFRDELRGKGVCVDRVSREVASVTDASTAASIWERTCAVLDGITGGAAYTSSQAAPDDGQRGDGDAAPADCNAAPAFTTDVRS